MASPVWELPEKCPPTCPQLRSALPAAATTPLSASPSRAGGVRVTTRRPPRHPDRARRACRPRRQAVGADAPPEEPTPRRPRPSNHAAMTSRRRRTSRCVAAPSGGPGVAASRRRWTSPPAAGRCRWRPVPRASCWEGVVACRRRRRCRGQPWRPLLAVCYLSYGTVQYLPYYKTKKYE